MPFIQINCVDLLATSDRNQSAVVNLQELGYSRSPLDEAMLKMHRSKALEATLSKEIGL